MEDTYVAQYLEAEKKHWWWIARRKIIERLVLKVLKIKQESAFRRALEIGCFSGMNVQALLPLARQWVGIEPSRVAISQARSNAPELEVHEGLFPDVHPSGSFDAVFMLDVLEHTEDASVTLKNVFSCVEPGGYFFVTVPAYMWLWSQFDIINQHYRRYTRRQLVKELTAAGFVIEYAGYFNSLLFVPAAAQRLLKKRGASNVSNIDTGAKIPSSPINLFLGFIFTLEKYILPYVKFPFGLSVIAIARRPR